MLSYRQFLAETSESSESDMHIATRQDVAVIGREYHNSYLLNLGEIFYTKKGFPKQLHRENGPAVITKHYVSYYIDGEPRVGLCGIFSDGSAEFYAPPSNYHTERVTREQKWQVLKEDVRSVMGLKLLTSEMQVFVVREDPSLIRYIPRLCKEAQEYVIQHRPDLISQIKNLDPKLSKKYQHELELGSADL